MASSSMGFMTSSAPRSANEASSAEVVSKMAVIISPDYQGRVFSLAGSLAGAAAPLGLIVVAPIGELLDVGVWYLAAGTTCVAMGITGYFAPVLMGIEDRTAEASPGG